MSEKCPVCQTGALEDWNRKVRQCDSCDFRCNTEDLPRIAAAMELAKELTALSKSDLNNAHREIEKRVEKAERRVLEVFGGE